MIVGWYVKDPDDVESYAIDWRDRLEGSTITGSEWLVPSGLTVVAGSPSFEPAVGTGCRLGGGELGRIYHVTNRATFADGRQLDAVIEVAII